MLRFRLKFLDHLLDLLCRLLGALSQQAYFVSHHRETTPRFSGPCRLYGRIQGQQISLLGYVTNDIEDGADLFRALFQRMYGDRGLLDILRQILNRLDGLRDFVATIVRRFAGLFRGVGGIFRVARNLFHGSGHFGDGGGHLIGFAVQRHHAFEGIAGGIGKPTAGPAQTVRLLLRLRQSGLHVVHELVEIGSHCGKFVFTVHAQPAPEILPAGDEAAGKPRQLAQRSKHPARHQQHAADYQQQGGQYKAGCDSNDVMDALIGNILLGLPAMLQLGEQFFEPGVNGFETGGGILFTLHCCDSFGSLFRLADVLD